MRDADVRRRASRLPMQWKAAVVFDHVQGKPIVHTRTEDLSSLGAAIFSEHGDATGSIVNLLLAPPGKTRGREQVVLKARARVVSTMRVPGMAQYRHGLSFLRTPDDGLEVLDEILGVEAGVAAPQAPAPRRQRLGPLGDPSAVVSHALEKTHRYLRDLVAQLNVRRPRYPKRYAIVGVPEFDGLAWDSGHTSMQQQLPPAAKLCREVSLGFRLSGGKQIRVTREYPANEKLRRFLQDARIGFGAEDRRNPRGLVEGTTFTFACEVAASLGMLAQFDSGKILLRASNVCGFGSMEQLLAPEAITDDSLAELAAFILAETKQLGPLLLKNTAGQRSSNRTAQHR